MAPRRAGQFFEPDTGNLPCILEAADCRRALLGGGIDHIALAADKNAKSGVVKVAGILTGNVADLAVPEFREIRCRDLARNFRNQSGFTELARGPFATVVAILDGELDVLPLYPTRILRRSRD